MKFVTKVLCFVLVYSPVSFAAANTPTEKVLVYRGTSDASAAVAVSEDTFIVADDENNMLRVYKTDRGGLPVFAYDLTDFLDVEPEHPEADIEGATMIEDRIYWITSHGRNKDGKTRPNRYRFFATMVEVHNGNVTVRPVGAPCKTLVHRLVKTKTMRHLGLDKATQFDATNLTKKGRKRLAPKEQGLNIEGLCASADGETIYLGFRNPRPYDRATGKAKALVVPLNNPKTVIDSGEPPIFGEPILWDLRGLGIRSMEYSDFHKAYFIIAGPHNESDTFVLYRWSGRKDTPPKVVCELGSPERKFSPEALITFKSSAGFLMLSDDGSLVVDVSNSAECIQGQLRKDGTCLNKFLTNPNKKCFRGIWH